MDLSSEYLWLGLGFALIIAEVTMGNFILFFIGLAAAITGIGLWLGYACRQRYTFYGICRLGLGFVGWRSFAIEVPPSG
jgi:membrane protein implicated in regulation of membrane protease activity